MIPQSLSGQREMREWRAFKAALTTVPVLVYYDPTKTLKISTDDSKDGLIAVLLQAEGERRHMLLYP